MLNLALSVLNFIINIPALGLIYYFWKPVTDWYLAKVPALGVDLYLSATYATYHLKHFSLPFNSFKDIWFGGSPLLLDFPQLVFYFMVPFVAKWGGPVGIQYFTMFSLFIFVICCYFLFFKLSRSQGLALFLATLVLLSPNIYGSATWAGSIPYFASQTFFPLSLLLGAFYLERANLRLLCGLILVTGIGFLIHPLGVLAFLIPSVYLIILFGGFYAKFPIKKIIGHFLIYNFGWIIAAFSTTHGYVINFLSQRALPNIVTSTSGAVEQTSEGANAIANFYKSQIIRLYEQSNPLVFKVLALGVVLFLIGFVLDKNKKRILTIIPFILIAAYCAALPAANLANIINLFRHDPYRAFWQFPVALGTLAAAFWGYFISAIFQRLSSGSFIRMTSFGAGFVLSLGFAVLTYVSFNNQIKGVISVIERDSEYTSAFPEALGIWIEKNQLSELKSQLVPSFMDPNDKNKRLYDADATVNIWWNTLFDMPLARGYLDPPIGTQNRGGFFWLDIAIANETLVRDFKIEENVAFNNSIFLIDWYAIGYFEGGRISSKGPSAGPSSYLIKNNVFDKEEKTTAYGGILKWQTASGKPELVKDLPQSLNYYRVADGYTSPILYPTNASPIVVFSSFAGYEDILRILASDNWNSKKIIPVNGGPFIDDLNLEQLEKFDAVILHDYKYHNQKKAFENLEKYVNSGGKLFIDTGSEVKESKNELLPAVFPIGASERKNWGREWDLKSGSSDILKDVDTSKFGPLVFNQDSWKLVTADPEKLGKGAKPILTNRDRLLLVERKVGDGQVIWSGINLPYHYNQYKSVDEAKLFLNILSQFTDVSEKRPLPAETQWLSPERVVIKTDEKAKGVLFKEEGWKGWTARVDGKSLPIYLAGPTFPGFMYVPLAKAGGEQMKVEFRYRGTPLYWMVFLVNMASILFLTDIFALRGKVFGKLFYKIFDRVLGRVSVWWRREEE